MSKARGGLSRICTAPIFNLNKYTMTKKHKVLIPMELYAPRWNVLKVNIVHHHELIKRVETKDEIRYHKRAIFQQIEELKRFDFMWDRTASSEEKKQIINLLNQ